MTDKHTGITIKCYFRLGTNQIMYLYGVYGAYTGKIKSDEMSFEFHFCYFILIMKIFRYYLILI